MSVLQLRLSYQGEILFPELIKETVYIWATLTQLWEDKIETDLLFLS